MTNSDSRGFPFLASVNGLLEQVNDQIIECIKDGNPIVLKVLEPFIRNIGKRIRPALVLLSAGATGYRGPKRLKYAALVELIHTASLFHDDVIDMAQTRRGSVSANQKLGNNLAILAGDYLYSSVIAIAMPENTSIQKRVNATVLGMTEGEFIQYFQQFKCHEDESQYFQIIGRKTALLFELSCWLGARLSENDKIADSFSSFGNNLGMAFQLIDDLLDWTATQSQLGKNTLQDLREGRMTLPAIILYQRLSTEDKTYFFNLFSNKKHTQGDLEPFRLQVLNSDIPEIIRNKAKKFAQNAFEAIGSLPMTPELDDLHKLGNFFINREY